MRKAIGGSFMVAVLLAAMMTTAGAITWGRQDVNNEYPNVTSLRGIDHVANSARISCSGSLLHRDDHKVVILTAAHCTDGWIAAIAAGTIHSVGVSFDLDNKGDGSLTDGNPYVRGGVPISYPAKDAPFEAFDYGLVVFAANAADAGGQTIADRWPTLTPVKLAPSAGYLPDLIRNSRGRSASLVFTAVGYGTGEKFPRPGQETGPADPSGANYSKFLVRYIAEGMTFSAYNPGNDVLRLSMNIAKGEDGTCNGDSGGPIFYQDPNPEVGRVQVSLVSGGDAPCRATNTGPGFSRENASAFLACATVTGDAADVAACVAGLF